MSGSAPQIELQTSMGVVTVELYVRHAPVSASPTLLDSLSVRFFHLLILGLHLNMFPTCLPENLQELFRTE
jgi:hypothetical protein